MHIAGDAGHGAPGGAAAACGPAIGKAGRLVCDARVRLHRVAFCLHQHVFFGFHDKVIAVHFDDLFLFQGDFRAPLVVDAHFPAVDLHPVRAVFRRHDNAVRRFAAQGQNDKLRPRRNPGRKAELLKNFRRFQFFAVQGVALRKLYAGLAVQPAKHGPERKAHGGERAGNGILDHLRGGHSLSP